MIQFSFCFPLHVDQDDGLSTDHWEFRLLQDKIAVDAYTRWTKTSKRHKAVAVQHWTRLDTRTLKNRLHSTRLKEQDVPLTPAIQEMARQACQPLGNITLTVSVGCQNRLPRVVPAQWAQPCPTASSAESHVMSTCLDGMDVMSAYRDTMPRVRHAYP